MAAAEGETGVKLAIDLTKEAHKRTRRQINTILANVKFSRLSPLSNTGVLFLHVVICLGNGRTKIRVLEDKVPIAFVSDAHIIDEQIQILKLQNILDKTKRALERYRGRRINVKNHLHWIHHDCFSLAELSNNLDNDILQPILENFYISNTSFQLLQNNTIAAQRIVLLLPEYKQRIILPPQQHQQIESEILEYTNEPATKDDLRKEKENTIKFMTPGSIRLKLVSYKVAHSYISNFNSSISSSSSSSSSSSINSTISATSSRSTTPIYLSTVSNSHVNPVSLFNPPTPNFHHSFSFPQQQSKKDVSFSSTATGLPRQ